ncbi:hypothetical protein JAAARDRAFT_174815 [Jaapia argillacea MUCL 33604]|uniref:COX assembly mitochondrial protein n=1 Tax=Jaapia argillacea MUCL 33604 TaxID=933084 RepID=A0A067QA77_9AGAM|nr:hypothetical protein JAAARDRAFT_174815 [Jaapia argillacea MUCL 33604]
MHPQSSDKRVVCREFFQALETCHGSPWLKFTGGCNTIKIQLNKCLHGESVKRASRNRVEAKVRREKSEKAWKDLHEDD